MAKNLQVVFAIRLRTTQCAAKDRPGIAGPGSRGRYAEYLAARATENLPTQPPPDAQPHLTNEEFTAVRRFRVFSAVFRGF